MLPIALVLSVLVGVALGMLGGGGSILTLPILMFALGMEEKAAIATSLIVVGVTSAAALISHARAGNVEWRTGLIFAAAGSAGAFLGGYAADWVPGEWLVRGFLVMMVLTAIAMIRGRKDAVADKPARPMSVPKVLLDGLVVGVVTGLVGAGGGFLVVPALLVIAIKSFAGFAGHATHVAIDYRLAALVSTAAVIGSFGGGLLAARVPQQHLRTGFGAFVLVMAVYMGLKQF